MTSICFFHDCINPALPTGKCEKHRGRIKCSEPNCYNQTYARNLCVRHGGKKMCSFPKCTANARCKGLCSKHGEPTTKRICEELGCVRVAHNRRRCVQHGGSRKCKVTNCISYSRNGGYCKRHSNSRANTPESSVLISEESSTRNTELFDIKLLDTPSLCGELEFDFTSEEFVILDFLIQ